jgi:phosphoglycolate phosphatase-like HAD superfamily hydrolase
MRRLAFIDLDLTLFDYTSVRRHATASALEALGVDRQVEIAKFIEFVAGPLGHVLEDLGFPNFRREWKAKELFALVLWLAESPAREGRLSRLLARNVSSGVTFMERWKRRQALLAGARRVGCAGLSAEVQEFLQGARTSRLIENAIRVFEEYLRLNMKEFPGAGGALNRLAEQGFESYVVSEGDERIQKEKLSLLSTDSRVMRSFITGECCRSELLLADLWDIAVAVDDTESDVARAVAVLYDVVLEYSLKTETFFRKVLQTLLLPPSLWDEFFRGFGWLSAGDIQNVDDVGLLLVGDRYEKDLLPALRAFESVIAVRLEFGKYRSHYDDVKLKELGLPVPALTVHSLSRIPKFISSIEVLPAIGKERIGAPPLSSQEVRAIRAAVATVMAGGYELPRVGLGVLASLEASTEVTEASSHGRRS